MFATAQCISWQWNRSTLFRCLQTVEWINDVMPFCVLGGGIFLFLIGLFGLSLWQIDRLQWAISEQKRSDSASKAKSVFLANMSHEIRTPLNAVLGFAQLVAKDPGLSQDGKQKLLTIQKAGKHLLSIINDILEMSRIEAGQSKVQPEDCNLPQFLDDLKMFFSLRARETGLSFKIEQAPDLPEYINIDQAKLRKILLNLVGNAFKYTPHGSVLLAVTSRGNQILEFLVRDTGIGLAADEIPQLFHPFQRTAAGQKVSSGTGLGLSISQEYAQVLGGDISVSSIPGAGSEFVLTISYQETEPFENFSSVNTIWHLATDQGCPMAIVVDDDNDSREITVAMLEGLGFIVSGVSSGAEALTAVNKDSPLLVMLDRRMPGLSGVDVARLLRNGKESVPYIIGISASALSGDAQDFMIPLLDGFLAKPYLESDLVAVIGTTTGLVFTKTVNNGGKVPEGKTVAFIDNLPLDWRERVRKALLSGNIGELRKLAEEIKTLDPQGFAYFDSCLKAYNLDRIRNWIEK